MFLIAISSPITLFQGYRRWDCDKNHCCEIHEGIGGSQRPMPSWTCWKRLCLEPRNIRINSYLAIAIHSAVLSNSPSYQSFITMARVTSQLLKKASLISPKIHKNIHLSCHTTRLWPVVFQHNSNQWSGYVMLWSGFDDEFPVKWIDSSDGDSGVGFQWW